MSAFREGDRIEKIVVRSSDRVPLGSKGLITRVGLTTYEVQ